MSHRRPDHARIYPTAGENVFEHSTAGESLACSRSALSQTRFLARSAVSAQLDDSTHFEAACRAADATRRDNLFLMPTR